MADEQTNTWLQMHIEAAGLAPNPPTEMVERIAQALHASQISHPQWSPGWPAIEADYWRGLARTAIEAMREPTEVMLKAGFTRVNVSTEERPSGLLGPWHGMIDAALGK